jgi:glycosyltransferase involved in cell wall biosynthesis
VTYNRRVDVLRVAVNASILGSRSSGLGQHARGLVRALDRQHAPLVVHTAMPDAVAPLRAVIRRAPSLVQPDRGAGAHLARLAWSQLGLPFGLARDGADVLLNTIPEGPLTSSVRQVTVVHDVIPLDFRRDYPRQQWYFRNLVPAVLRRARVVVAVSEATRRRVIDAYGLPAARVRTIHNGFDAERFGPDGPAEADGGVPYLVFIGNLLPHKNLPRLIEASAIAAARAPLRLVVVGRGRPPVVAALRALAERCGVAVDLRAFVPPADVPAVLRGARALVLPSLAEGFGLPAVEAMACGTPVVAADVPALREVVGAAAVLVDPLDVDALAEAITRVVSDDRLAKELGAHGLEQAARFSWERCAAEMLDVLREAAG